MGFTGIADEDGDGDDDGNEEDGASSKAAEADWAGGWVDDMVEAPPGGAAAARPLVESKSFCVTGIERPLTTF